MRIQQSVLFLICVSLVAACGGSSSGSNSGNVATGTPGEIVSQVPAEKFFTAQNPGRWKERKDEHELLVREVRTYYVGKQKLREIEITVPMEGTPQHYLEAGLILDNSLKKEFSKISFELGKPKYSFKLSAPADEPNVIYAVIKCNQHDMWLKRVEPLPKKKDSGE